MRNVQTTQTPGNLAPAWGMSQQNMLRPRCETESTRQLSCDVVFGSPSADCMGTGVCRITARSAGSPHASDRKRNCQSTVGLLFPIEGGKGLSIVLTRALLCTKLYKTHLRTGTLTLESPCKLSKELVKRLGLSTNELEAGQYPVQEKSGFLRIDFKAPQGR